jgi:YbbR domain-containing protein
MAETPKTDDIISSPMFLRVMAVVIAFAFWFYASGSRTTETTRSLSVPLEYLNVPPQTTMKGAVKEVEIVLSGTPGVLSSLSPEAVVCEVDARGLGVGKYRLAVRAIAPKDVKLVDVVPTHVDIELLRYIDRLIPVEVAVEKGLPPGLFLDMVEIVPKDVSVKGSEKDLAKIGSARISPTLDDLKAGGELSLPVEIVKSEEFEDEVSFEPKRVKFRAVLAEGVPKKNVPVNARIIGKPLEDFRLKAVVVEPALVAVEGPLAKLERVTKVDTETIDITDIAKEQNMVIPLRSPDDPLVKIVGAPSVRVNVLLTPFTVTRLVSRVAVEVEGRSVYPKWKVEPPSVNITVEGVPSEVNSLDEKELLIQPFVNVTNVVSRRLTVPVQVRNRTEGKLKVVRVEPSNITVIADVQ